MSDTHTQHYLVNVQIGKQLVSQGYEKKYVAEYHAHLLAEQYGRAEIKGPGVARVIVWSGGRFTYYPL